ncbi:MAG: sulfatase-like hydrolase/transferase [Enterococcus casseliflavus]
MKTTMAILNISMPGITSIGDILHDNGYNQILLLGSDADFGGRKKFYEQHGDYEIRDYNYANDHGWIPKDRKVWWGYEDEKLFEFAKNTLLEQASLDQPFNLTMLLAADTHFPDGYKNENTPEILMNSLAMLFIIRIWATLLLG